jgi:hypothetical protein
MVNSEQKARFTESDVDDFAMTISDHYNQLLKDDHIPAPILKMPALGAHTHAASLSEDNYEDTANALGVAPQALLSMMNTRSGNNLETMISSRSCCENSLSTNVVKKEKNR